ncbi:hypothetical protein LIER_39778 [Lithospermum erythrorhizon]|uniref:Uncharacterized protein n=1 Tax=Lithospermum erythrorhizon TaxID=34254 RepID=A0AAV3QPC0_LITER
MITRTKTNSLKPKAFQVSKYPLSLEMIEPTSYSQAKGNLAWEKAMQDEYLALVRNGTWTLVAPPHNHNVINCK